MSEIIISKHYNRIFHNAIKSQVSEFRIVTAYTSLRIITKILKETLLPNNMRMRLIIGDIKHQGICNDIQELKKLERENAKHLSIRVKWEDVDNDEYIIHSKIYIWINKNEIPIKAYIGSANLSRNGMEEINYEVLSEADPIKANIVFKGYCEVTQLLRLYKTPPKSKKKGPKRKSNKN